MAEAAAAKDATYTNPRGIPRAPFVDKVEEFVTNPEDINATLRKFDEMLSKYKFMEVNRIKQLQRLRSSIPDMQKTLDTVKFLDSKKDAEEELKTRFELNDTLYATASIPPTDEVYLWLGANVMVAYPIDEAMSLLTQKLSSQENSMKTCQEDLEFLREQITTMEVNIARTYNWDVKKRRQMQTTTVQDGSDDEDT